MNGLERIEYPKPLMGDTADALTQIRAYLFQIADAMNRVIGKLEDLERQQEGSNGSDN